MSLDSLFDRFIRERIYIKNVTPATREWYASVDTQKRQLIDTSKPAIN